MSESELARYRISWCVVGTEFVGHGEGVLTRDEAVSEAADLNRKYVGVLFHWAELAEESTPQYHEVKP